MTRRETVGVAVDSVLVAANRDAGSLGEGGGVAAPGRGVEDKGQAPVGAEGDHGFVASVSGGAAVTVPVDGIWLGDPAPAASASRSAPRAAPSTMTGNSQVLRCWSRSSEGS